MFNLDNPSPYDILQHVCSSNPYDSDDFTYIILGKSGPTGKTWLCDQLKNRGFNAFEISEDMSCADVFIEGRNSNHFIVNEHSKSVTIILNRPL